jgi:dCMP deaminase
MPNGKDPKIPDFREYYMGIAMEVRARANCTGNRIGAIAVLNNRVVSTGYNGTPENTDNCLDGGCHRCSNRDKYPAGTGYDLCICVHAEQNVLLSAARFGIGLDGGTIYTTMRPCFGCTKEMLQAGIKGVYYIHDWQHPDADKQAEYGKLQARFTDGIRKIDMEDPLAEWAVSSKRRLSASSSDETGHPAP